MGVAFQKPSKNIGRKTSPVISEINMTPFIDVMLVLLVIFMVTAPLMTVGISVTLPKTTATVVSEKSDPLTITINKEEKLFIQETETPKEALIERLKLITGQNPEAKIYVKGDKDLSYGKIMEVMGLIHSAGFVKVVMVGEMQQSNPNTKPSSSVQKESSFPIPSSSKKNER